MKHIATLKSMQIFLIVWAGQFVSLLGSRMTRFALIIWAYQQTGDATTLALLGFFSYLPIVLVSPIAGVWVDRLDRRLVMILADSGSALSTAGLLILYATGNLQIWHLYLAEGLSGFFDAFQSPAYIAASSLLVPKAHYGRASGLRSLATNGADVIAPAFAGLLLGLIGIQGVMVLDVITFFAALGTLLVVRFPPPPRHPETEAMVPEALSESGIPFTGCPAKALRLALDKARTKVGRISQFGSWRQLYAR